MCVYGKVMSIKREKCETRFHCGGEKMDNNLTAEEVLEYLIETLETDLAELLDAKFKNEFIVGEWHAYIECLEIIFNWKKAKQFGLNYNPELKYKIS